MVAANIAATITPSMPCGRIVMASVTNAASVGSASAGHIPARSGKRTRAAITGRIHINGNTRLSPAHHSAIFFVSRSSGTL